jgi:hypothetical protein
MMGYDNVTHLLGGIPGASGAYAFFWLYNRLIADPLRVLYFFSWWSNIPDQEICGRLTSVPGTWWAQSPDRMLECSALLERNFMSWEATVLVCLYFAVLVTGTTWLLLRLCLINPLVRAIGGRRQREEDDERPILLRSSRPSWVEAHRISRGPSRPRSYSSGPARQKIDTGHLEGRTGSLI